MHIFIRMSEESVAFCSPIKNTSFPNFGYIGKEEVKSNFYKTCLNMRMSV